MTKVGAGSWESAVTTARGNFPANNGLCNVYTMVKIETDTMLICIGFLLTETSIYNVLFLTYSLVLRM